MTNIAKESSTIAESSKVESSSTEPVAKKQVAVAERALEKASNESNQLNKDQAIIESPKQDEPTKNLERTISVEEKNIKITEEKTKRRVSFEKPQQQEKVISKTQDEEKKETLTPTVMEKTDKSQKEISDSTVQDTEKKTTNIRMIKKKKKKTKPMVEDEAINFEDLDNFDIDKAAALPITTFSNDEDTTVIEVQPSIDIKTYSFIEPKQLTEQESMLEIVELEDEDEGISALPTPSGNLNLKSVVPEDRVTESPSRENIQLKPVRQRNIQQIEDDQEIVSLKPVLKSTKQISKIQEDTTQSINIQKTDKHETTEVLNTNFV